MLRYLAARAGLQGQTPSEVVTADMVAESIKDVRHGVVTYAFAADAAAHIPTVALPLVTKFFPHIEGIIVRNGQGTNGWILPSGMSYADILLAELFEEYCLMFVDDAENLRLVKSFECIASVHARVMAIPTVAEYLASDRRFPFPYPGGAICDAYVANVRTVLGRK